VQQRIKTRRQHGFSLLEMLVALTVLGLLMVGLNEGVRTGLGLWSAQTRHVGGIAQLDSTARLLRSLLVSIPLGPAAASDPGSPPVAISFSGSADQLAFVGDMPTGLGSTRRANITLALDDGRLILLWTPHRHEQLGTAPIAEKTELLGGIAGIEFAYWGTSDAASPATWLTQWAGPAMPQLIRIHLALAKGDNRRWPDIVVAPQLAKPQL
jgi:general secretion pathway protein J